MAAADEILDYDDVIGDDTNANQAADIGADADESHVGIHGAGFRDFLLKQKLMQAIADCGFEHPSEVQYRCIPKAVLGNDILCQAKSGMGKTAVFVLSILQQLDTDREVDDVKVLVVCHTRELAVQIKNEFDRFSKHFPTVKTEVFYGGVPEANNLKTLREVKPNIVVGTPGRTKQLIEQRALKVDKVAHFIIDECDKVLEKNDMRGDVQRIFVSCPVQKQVMMFSATLPKEVRPIARKFMRDPMEVFVDAEAELTLHGLQQYYVKLEENEKNRKLMNLLDALEFNQVVIFVRSCLRADELSRLLKEQEFPSISIHSNLPQEQRLKRYKDFKDFQSRILVSTDVFGRGMDIERVNIVFNYDMPENSDTYLHRVARAGRFGTKGLAITFSSSPEDREVLEKVQARFEVKISELPDQIAVESYMSA